jgi:hypothetical protein
MNALTADASVTWKQVGVRTRIVRSMTDFVDGYASVKALADAMDEFIHDAKGKGAAKITSADLTRASGSFGTPISEAKMTAIIKFLKTKRVNGFSDNDISKEKTFKFVTGLNYVVSARKNVSVTKFAKTIGATELEINDAESGRPIREELLSGYTAAIKSTGSTLKQIQ